MSKGAAASEATTSTISSAGWPAASIARRTAATSEVIAVAVSVCTISTALISAPVSWRSRSSITFGSSALRQSLETTSTSTPKVDAISAQLREKCPTSGASTLSPGESTLTSAASQAPWPFDM